MGPPSERPLCLFVTFPSFFGSFPHFSHHRVLGLVLGFPALALESAMSAGALLPCTKEWDVEAKIWE